MKGGGGGSQPEERCSGSALPRCPRARDCGRETWGDSAAGTTFDLPRLRPFPRPKALSACPQPSSKPGLVNTDAGDRKGPACSASHVVNHTKTPTSQTAGLCPHASQRPSAGDALTHDGKGRRGHSQALSAIGPNADFSRQTKSTQIKGVGHLEPHRTDGAARTAARGGGVSAGSGVGSPPRARVVRAACGLRRANLCLRLPVRALGQTQGGSEGQAGF